PLLQSKPTTVPADMSRELPSYRDVVKKVLPAVVSIKAESRVKARRPTANNRRRNPADDPRIPDEFRRFFEEMPFGRFGDEDGAMPSPGPAMGFGSGLIVDPKGVILTNFHVVDGADRVTVELRDGRTFESKKIVTDRKTDLAIVRIESKSPLPYLEL